MLTISDMPQGWSTSKSDSDDTGDTSQMEAQLSDCLHAPPGLIGDEDGPDSTHVDSPDFNSPDGNTTIDETVSVSTPALIDEGFTVLKAPTATDCYATAVNALLKQEIAQSTDKDLKSATIGDADVGQLNAGRYGDDTVAMRVTIPLSVSGFSSHVYLDVIFIRHSNAVATLEFESTGTPVDTHTTAQFAQLATRKLAQGTYPAPGSLA